MDSTKMPQFAPPSATTPTAETPPPTAAPTYTMDPADVHQLQQIHKRLDKILYKMMSLFSALTDVYTEFIRMCSENKYKPYMDHDLEVNLVTLEHTCVYKREPLEEVIKIQRDIVKRARMLHETDTKERRLDAEFWGLINKYKKG